jgi:dipeptidase E
MDSNDAGIQDTSGLGLLGYYAIWCHYVEEHDSLISRYGYPIIAIPERSGITFDGSVISVIGFESVTVFDRGHQQVLPPNSTMPVF